MCTVSIFAQKERTLITMNRDERRTREEASEPRHGEESFYPIDAQSGGTWCALHGRGYALTLLNRYQTEYQHSGTDSRGMIIPELLQLSDFSEVIAYLNPPNLYRFSPFDLLLIKREQLFHFSWDGEVCKRSEISLADGPQMFTSSSERTAEVIAYRAGLFDKFCTENPAPESSDLLEKLHCVCDAVKPRDGILVDRPEVHSKSICQIVLDGEGPSIQYWPESAVYPRIASAEVAPFRANFSRRLAGAAGSDC